jgi:hypothetical protein
VEQFSVAKNTGAPKPQKYAKSVATDCQGLRKEFDGKEGSTVRVPQRDRSRTLHDDGSDDSCELLWS